jgi:hypothetical protein
MQKEWRASCSSKISWSTCIRVTACATCTATSIPYKVLMEWNKVWLTRKARFWAQNGSQSNTLSIFINQILSNFGRFDLTQEEPAQLCISNFTCSSKIWDQIVMYTVFLKGV